MDNREVLIDNKEIIIEFNVAFDKGVSNDIARFVTDDFEWHMLGDSVIKGKDNFLQFFVDHPDMKMISVTKDHIIVDGNTASLDGEVQCTDKSGKIYDMYYCDVYELENGLIKKMISYTVDKNKASVSNT